MLTTRGNRRASAEGLRGRLCGSGLLSPPEQKFFFSCESKADLFYTKVPERSPGQPRGDNWPGDCGVNESP